MSGGYFTVALNFADYFDGAARWLEVEVRPGASTGNYTPLTPRTSLTGVPYALALRPGATVNTTTANLPALKLNAPNANSNALVATGNGNGYAVIYAEDLSATGWLWPVWKVNSKFRVVGISQAETGVYGQGTRGVWGWDPGVQGTGDDYGVVGVGSFGGVAGIQFQRCWSQRC